MPRERKDYHRAYYAKHRDAINARRRARRVAAKANKPKTKLSYSPRTAKAKAESVAQWAAENLIVPTPPKAGEPFRLDPWQVEFLEGALADGIREAGLSVGRRNGKTFTIAVLCLAHLVGPLNARYWRAAAVSLTGKNCLELRTAIEQIAAESNLDGVEVKRSPFPGGVEGVNGASMDFLAADKASGHSVGLDMALIDEAGLLDESKRGLWNAMTTSTGGRNGRVICFSVQGSGPMYAEMRERRDKDSVHWCEYSAPDDCELDDRDAWLAANPGLLTGTKSMGYMEDASERAQGSPADALGFRVYDLNQPADPARRETIVAVADWTACLRPAEAQGPCYVGFDLGGSVSMGAFAAYWPMTGLLRVQCGLPAKPDLKRRGMADGVGRRYLDMEAQGCLRTYPGRVLPVVEFLQAGAALVADADIRAAGCDRYRAAETAQALEDAGLHHWPLTWRGTGAHKFAHGSADVRAFQRAVLGKQIASPPNLALESAIAESELRYDPAGNPALDKARHRGRIDALQAAVIALGLAEADAVHWRDSEGADGFGLIKIG